jgi:glycosyltransferase involved in cell wall biosynthesis
VILGIDAANIRFGGGVTHLLELLRAVEPQGHGFSKVIVWGGGSTLMQVEDRPWLVKSHLPMLDRSLSFRAFWQRFRLSALARAAGCDVLFVPGGTYAGAFHPVVTMSRNLLPFEWHELRRFGWSRMTLKLMLLRVIQTRAFRHSDGLIFLTRYARDTVMGVIRSAAGRSTIVPHGIDERFKHPPREQLPIGSFSADRPFRILYVSIVDMYKHQWHVAQAVADLRAGGIPVVLDLVGPAYAPALRRLQSALTRLDPGGEFIHYSGLVPRALLPERYMQNQLCVFASSCENMPNILLEGMASGLPIACSNRGPMPEVLGEAGVYFDPEDPAGIATVLRDLIASPAQRTKLARASFEGVRLYSWRRCADETFGFLSEIAAGCVRREVTACGQRTAFRPEGN